MMWYVPACVREADTISIGDQLTQHNLKRHVEADVDENNSSSTGFSSLYRPKSRGRSEDRFESNFSTIATSLTTLIEKNKNNNSNDKLAYHQMYAELDKVLEKATFLDAIKFLTATIESANAKFPTSSNNE